MNYYIIKTKIMNSYLRRNRMRAIPFFILIGIAAVALFGFVVMSLWNAILVPLLHVGLINFWQALGIFILAKLLFGGFPQGRRRHDYRHAEWKRMSEGMKEKWSTMTQEEKEKFKQEWKNRCRGWRGSEEMPPAGAE